MMFVGRGESARRQAGEDFVAVIGQISPELEADARSLGMLKRHAVTLLNARLTPAEMQVVLRKVTVGTYQSYGEGGFPTEGPLAPDPNHLVAGMACAGYIIKLAANPSVQARGIETLAEVAADADSHGNFQALAIGLGMLDDALGGGIAYENAALARETSAALEKTVVQLQPLAQL